MSCLPVHRRWSDCMASKGPQEEVYSNAADINFRNPENPKWWFYNDKTEDFLRSPNSAIGAVEDEKGDEMALNIAVDSIRFLRDELNKYQSLTWQDVRNTRPVLFVTSDPDRRQRRYNIIDHYPPPLNLNRVRSNNAEGNLKGAILNSMINQFFYGLRPLIPQNWQPWFSRFDMLSIDDQLDVLESLPRPLPPMLSPVDQRLCILVGLDDAYSQYTHGQVTRFLRIIEQSFIADGRGKILLICVTPFNIIDMLKDESCVIKLK
ncbi:uncharacterized protein F4807DRAFT_176321 [Annulohypoxylon truncatum]|uniref:uncharacterized protein n=1 Tax=Annulohypoxylon truncatum TaxID=327061 RepID=UPI002007C28C|nr:uncharacterized protein F4807DRAFT_176321 [Annulohypoxylon truncatum]KAI1207394.1 hypothetical protein F4807DRAFT_176321 [Annulohypoxylon truncatum]